VPLLITESEEEFKPIRQALYEELGPVGIIEQMYVNEFADIVWEILRLKRCKAGVINLTFHDASARFSAVSSTPGRISRATGFPIRISQRKSNRGSPSTRSTARSSSLKRLRQRHTTSSRSNP
jgi:hypothetical protein